MVKLEHCANGLETYYSVYAITCILNTRSSCGSDKLLFLRNIFGSAIGIKEGFPGTGVEEGK